MCVGWETMGDMCVSVLGEAFAFKICGVWKNMFDFVWMFFWCFFYSSAVSHPSLISLFSHVNRVCFFSIVSPCIIFL